MDIREDNGKYIAEYSIMGKKYTELFDSNGEYIRFIGDEFNPYKKNIIEIAYRYNQDCFTNSGIQNILHNLIKLVKSSKIKELDNKNKQLLIQSLENDNIENGHEIQTLKDNLETERISNIISNHNNRIKNIKINGGRMLLKLFGNELPNHISAGDFKDDIKNHTIKLIQKEFTVSYKELEFIYNLIESLDLINANYKSQEVPSLEDLVKSFNECFSNSSKDSETIRNLLKKVIDNNDITIIDFKDYSSNGNILNNFAKALQDGIILFSRQKIIGGSDENHFNSEYFNNIKNDNPYLSKEIDDLESYTRNELEKNDIKRASEEEFEKNKLKNKLSKVKEIDNILINKIHIYKLFFILSIILFVISIIIIIIKSVKEIKRKCFMQNYLQKYLRD